MTRITKLPEHDNVLVGRDLGGVFEAGYVYDFREILGEIIIKKLGKSSIVETPVSYGTIEVIMTSSYYLLTKEEEEEIE